jgi:hypothetical protein
MPGSEAAYSYREQSIHPSSLVIMALAGGSIRSVYDYVVEVYSAERERAYLPPSLRLEAEAALPKAALEAPSNPK